MVRPSKTNIYIQKINAVLKIFNCAVTLQSTHNSQFMRQDISLNLSYHLYISLHPVVLCLSLQPVITSFISFSRYTAAGSCSLAIFICLDHLMKVLTNIILRTSRPIKAHINKNDNFYPLETIQMLKTTLISNLLQVRVGLHLGLSFICISFTLR